MKKFKIIGAGLAGLIAGNMLPTSAVFEKNDEEDRPTHKAILRFKRPLDDLGVECERVTVRKGIWYDNKFVPPNPRVCNLYAQKVTNRVLARSIWDCRPAERYIPPFSLQKDLEKRLAGRIFFNTEADFDVQGYDAIISTLPMSVMVKLFDLPENLQAGIPRFDSRKIHVRKFKINGANVHQTVYFPHPHQSVYRASLAGDVLIVEAINSLDFGDFWTPFGLNENDLEIIDLGVQSLGKIAPIDDVWRRSFIGWLSDAHKIYSLGRFATWRPDVKVMDVIADVQKIKRLAENPYERRLAL